MEYVLKGSWLICLTAAAIEDLKTRQISFALLFAGMIPGIWNLCNSNVWEHLCAAAIGVFILLLSGITKGAIGEGDGWFFLFSALYWDMKQVSILFFGSLGIGCIWGMGIFMYGIWNREQRKRNATIPFLTCAWPVGVWLVIQW